MKIILKLFVILISSLTIVNCSMFKIHQVQIQQGNIIDPKQVAQLKPGMSSQQVRDLLGTPVMVDTFRDHRYHYIYRLQIGDKLINQKHLIVLFKNDRLESFKATNIHAEEQAPKQIQKTPE